MTHVMNGIVCTQDELSLTLFYFPITERILGKFL